MTSSEYKNSKMQDWGSQYGEPWSQYAGMVDADLQALIQHFDASLFTAQLTSAISHIAKDFGSAFDTMLRQLAASHPELDTVKWSLPPDHVLNLERQLLNNISRVKDAAVHVNSAHQQFVQFLGTKTSRNLGSLGTGTTVGATVGSVIPGVGTVLGAAAGTFLALRAVSKQQATFARIWSQRFHHFVDVYIQTAKGAEDILDQWFDASFGTRLTRAVSPSTPQS